jgi:hypothetical protein
MAEPSHLGHILAAVRNIDGVFDVYRITGAGHRAKGISTPRHDGTRPTAGLR